MTANRGFICAYGTAHFAKSLLWYSSELLFSYALTTIFGFSPLFAGVVLALGLLLNAAVDLAAGAWMTNNPFDIGDAGRIQLWGAALSAIAFCAFGFSGFAAAPAKTAAITLSLSVFRLAYPVLDVPQNALLALAGRRCGGEHRLSALRMMAGGGASLSVAALFAPVLQGRRTDVQVGHFAVITAVAASLALLSAVFLYGSTRRLDGGNYERRAPTAAGRIKRLSLTFPMLLAALALVAAASAAFAQMEPYLSSYVIGTRMKGGLTMILVAAGSIASQPAWAALVDYRGLPKALAGAGVAWSAGAAILLLELAAPVSPPTVFGLASAGFVYGCGSGGTIMALWAIVAREVRSKPGGTASAFAAVGASSKVGGALSAVLTAALLSVGDFRESGRSGPLIWVCLAPAAVGLICLAISFPLARRASPQSL